MLEFEWQARNVLDKRQIFCIKQWSISRKMTQIGRVPTKIIQLKITKYFEKTKKYQYFGVFWILIRDWGVIEIVYWVEFQSSWWVHVSIFCGIEKVGGVKFSGFMLRSHYNEINLGKLHKTFRIHVIIMIYSNCTW